MKAILFPLALLLGACSPPVASMPQSEAPAVITERMPGGPPPARGEQLLRDVMLSRQNAARRAVDAPPLVWNEALVASARSYARELAVSGRFEHARQSGVPQGENLWIGTRGAFSYREMVDAWIAERADYVPGPVPQNSRNGKPVGHYTQMIWRSTRAVGCAVAANRQNEVLVCRYSPAGNVVGRRPDMG
ncbi:CAP domain-containing protein [Novosphingopyxis sp. YJ-S2-01]|uniref:CAP domain-containing protein n=1 Tax=Novosphingopyxis sp. YJ-S2-01 TaxID=2794021 RepID=UPI0018DE93B5|nr:CAP domain-containing protein [Novosphingopyxis sp. YJ-S2-01]MBH9537677.1 serine protease [Novosphingopyxis sp. YJ-S2-01]